MAQKERINDYIRGKGTPPWPPTMHMADAAHSPPFRKTKNVSGKRKIHTNQTLTARTGTKYENRRLVELKAIQSP